MGTLIPKGGSRIAKDSCGSSHLLPFSDLGLSRTVLINRMCRPAGLFSLAAAEGQTPYTQGFFREVYGIRGEG